jgi:hypothetical protein
VALVTVLAGGAHVAATMGFRPKLEHVAPCDRTRPAPRTSGADAVRTPAVTDRLLGALGRPLEDEG